MILTALKDLADFEGLVENPDFQPIEVRWFVDFGPGGDFLSATDTQQKPEGGKGKPRGRVEMVPKRSKRSGTGAMPEFIVDKPSYVFGWVHLDAAEKSRKDGRADDYLPGRAVAQFAAYVAEVRLAADATRDEALLAWLALLDGGGPPCEQFPGWTEGDLISPRFAPDGGVSLAQRDAVMAYWKQRRGGPPPAGAADQTAALPTCLVTGRPAPPVRLHPNIKGVPPVSDTKGGVPFTSINADAFDSYGLRGVGGATVSQGAADAYQAALNRLLSPGYPHPRKQGESLGVRNVRLSDDTAVVFWARHDDAGPVDLFAEAVTRGEPDHVRALYGSPWKGSAIDLGSADAFYALTLSGAIGRGTVRGWHETTLGAALKNLRRYFEETRITNIDSSGLEDNRPKPLLAMVSTLAPKQKTGRNAPSSLAAELFAAILAGRAFPREVLTAAVARTRVEKDKKYQRYQEWQRFALLRGYLVRARRYGLLPSSFPEVLPMVDEKCLEPAYRLGRLFAVLERVQMDAISPNATIRDRYYGAASATPVVVFPQLLRKLPAHLKNSSRSVFFEKLVQEIIYDLPAKTFPSILPLEGQGLFAIGYYHESQALFDKSVNESRKARYFSNSDKDS